MSNTAKNTGKAWFELLVTVALRRPGASLLGVLVAMVAGGALAVFGPLDVSTSRRSLVSEKSPYQARLFEFFERFGRPDSVVLVVSGGTAQDQRRFVDRVEPRLEAIPALEGRVIGRFSPSSVAEVLFLNRPQLLEQLGQMESEKPPTWVELARRLENRVAEALDGGAVGREGETTTGSLDRLALLIGVLADDIRGGPARLGLNQLAASTATEGTLDDEGYLVTADGKHHLVTLFPVLTSDEGKDLAPLVDRIRAQRDAVLSELGGEGLRVDVTGMPALAADELRIIRSGLRLTSTLSALGILLLLYIAFRSLRASLIAVVPMLAGIVITLGVVELLYGGLNLVTSSFTSVLMGLGIDFGVHLIHRYAEGTRRGLLTQDDALRDALVRAGPGVTTGAVTTVIAYLTITTTQFEAFAQLGVITAIGLFVMMLSAFLVVPTLLRRFSQARVAGAALPGVGRVMNVVARFPRVILAGAVGLTVLSVVSFLPHGPSFNGRYFDFLPEDTESYRGLEAIEHEGGMGPVFVNFEVESFAEARRLTERLRAQPLVGRVQSVTDLLPALDPERLAELRRAVKSVGAIDRFVAPRPVDLEELEAALVDLQDIFDEVAFALVQAGRDPAAARRVSAAIVSLRKSIEASPKTANDTLVRAAKRLDSIAARALATARDVARRGRYAPEDLPALFRARYVSKDGSELAVYAHPAGDVWDEAFSERFSKAILAIDPDASGLALNVLPHERYIVDGFKRAALYSAVLIFLVLLVVFRRVQHAALAMFPVLLGWTWMIGAMKPLGLSFTPANLVALPLLLGIGLDAGAHMVHRFRESRAEGEARARLADMMLGTGEAVIVSSLTTMAGFGALMVADYRAMKSLGLLLTVGIGLCLMASVLVLPALLVALRRAK